ncbi:MAG: hypothetical protein ABSH23_11570 [Steroidobacteraceae bacterium]
MNSNVTVNAKIAGSLAAALTMIAAPVFAARSRRNPPWTSATVSR